MTLCCKCTPINVVIYGICWPDGLPDRRRTSSSKLGGRLSSSAVTSNMRSKRSWTAVVIGLEWLPAANTYVRHTLIRKCFRQHADSRQYIAIMCLSSIDTKVQHRQGCTCSGHQASDLHARHKCLLKEGCTHSTASNFVNSQLYGRSAS